MVKISAFLLTLLFTISCWAVKRTPSKAQFQYTPEIKKMMEWQKAGPNLEKILIRNGWWRKETFTHMPGMPVLENKKHTQPFTFVVKMNGSVGGSYAKSIHEAGMQECEKAKGLVPGSVAINNFDKKTETFACWVYRPATKENQIEHHLFLTMRSHQRGSSHFSAEAAEVPMDKTDKVPNPLARSIASALGAK